MDMLRVYDIEWALPKEVLENIEDYDIPHRVEVPFSVYAKDGYCGVVDYIYEKYGYFAKFLRFE